MYIYVSLNCDLKCSSSELTIVTVIELLLKLDSIEKIFFTVQDNIVESCLLKIEFSKENENLYSKIAVRKIE